MNQPIDWKAWTSLSLHERNGLPTTSGIYVVVDCNDNVWYVGQAVNLNSRWSGRGHHRLLQLSRLHGKRRYQIYWIFCSVDELDRMEKYYIDLFQPSINGTKVKQYALTKPQLKLKISSDSDTIQYVYFRGDPKSYVDITEYVDIYPCTPDDEKNVAIDKSKLIKQGLVGTLAIRYEVNGKQSKAEILCSLQKRSQAIVRLLNRLYRGGKILKVWIPRHRRFIG